MKHSIYTSYDELPLMLSVAEVAAVLGISVPVPMSWCMATNSPRSKSAAGSLFQRISFSHGSTRTAVQKRTAVTKEQALNFLRANEAADQNRETHRCCGEKQQWDHAAQRGRDASEQRRA